MTTKNFEALICTPSRTVAALCAVALADLPIDWIMADSSQQAKRYLARDEFDFVLIDFESEDAEDLLLSSAAANSLVLVMTSRPVDARILCLSHEYRFYYPVRPAEVPALMQSLATLADNLASKVPVQTILPSPARTAGRDLPSRSGVQHAASKREWIASLEGETVQDSSKQKFMQHSLSITTQERVASIIAAIGSIWYVQQITGDFRGLQVLGPPAPGPIELIVVALLLWICAKHRRVLRQQQPATPSAVA